MDAEHLIGQDIDRYQIIEHIARGGMADVYLAEDVDLERKVALKVMLDTLSIDSQFVQRFRREAQTVAKLEHTNIVQIYSFGLLSSNQPFLAMQYIEGGSLRDKLQELAERSKLLTTEQALNIARQIAQALAAAHNAHVVHRDLKPSNVLIRPDGAPVLVDLGIAVVSDGTKLTQTGSLIGTPYYMSPEQVRGKPLDGRSDLYSLGIILYEISAGMRPFEADESIAVLHKQVYEDPLPLDKFRPDLTPQTLHIIETALKKDPSQRFQSAEEMILAIDYALQAEGLQGPNPQATHVLTRLEDEALVSRHRLVRVPTAAQPALRQRIPLWVIVTLSVLGATVILFFLFRTFGGGDGTGIAEIAAAATKTTAAEPEIVYITAIVTETPNSLTPTTDSEVVVVSARGTSTVTSTAVVPTDTPAPSPTPEPTASPTAAPTDTPLPTPIPTDTPIPQPTPCGIAVYIAFSGTWNAHFDQLGCPAASGKSGVWLAQEDFGGGRMFWREDNDRIYVLYNSGRWASYADIWRDSDPEYTCGTPESPPTPKRGFGKIWCTYDAVRTGLGNATDVEWGEQGAVQDFTDGLILQTGSGRTYVFYNNGTWR